MGVEIVLNPCNPVSLGEVGVGAVLEEVLENVGKIDGSAALSNGDMVPWRQPSSGANNMNMLATPARSDS